MILYKLGGSVTASRVTQADTTAGRVARLAGPSVRASRVPERGSRRPWPAARATRAGVHAHARRVIGAATPRARQGDRSQALAPFKNVTCMLFKAA